MNRFMRWLLGEPKDKVKPQEFKSKLQVDYKLMLDAVNALNECQMKLDRALVEHARNRLQASESLPYALPDVTHKAILVDLPCNYIDTLYMAAHFRKESIHIRHFVDKVIFGNPGDPGDVRFIKRT